MLKTIYSLGLALLLFPAPAAHLMGEQVQNTMSSENIDKKVEAFLAGRRWRDLNVSRADGKILYDLIIKNQYKKALEIGTSTGHSGIWIAWALSKTGGRLTTLEIDEGRYREAVNNFKEAGLSDYIEAKLGDAHQLVKELEGPFDFVFCDADKYWYKNYFVDVYPKLEIGGCFAAHNVYSSRGGRSRRGGTAEFYEYVLTLEDMETQIVSSSGGMSVSYKRAGK